MLKFEHMDSGLYYTIYKLKIKWMDMVKQDNPNYQEISEVSPVKSKTFCYDLQIWFEAGTETVLLWPIHTWTISQFKGLLVILKETSVKLYWMWNVILSFVPRVCKPLYHIL